jgi:hypothetical protein
MYEGWMRKEMKASMMAREEWKKEEINDTCTISRTSQRVKESSDGRSTRWSREQVTGGMHSFGQCTSQPWAQKRRHRGDRQCRATMGARVASQSTKVCTGTLAGAESKVKK